MMYGQGYGPGMMQQPGFGPGMMGLGMMYSGDPGMMGPGWYEINGFSIYRRMTPKSISIAGSQQGQYAAQGR
jgi:hypothetical protein